MRSVIVELDEGRSYADSTRFGDLTLLFRHTLDTLPTGTRVTHRLEIHGPDADDAGPELGPQISGDFPVTMDGLLAAARAGPSPYPARKGIEGMNGALRRRVHRRRAQPRAAPVAGHQRLASSPARRAAPVRSHARAVRPARLTVLAAAGRRPSGHPAATGRARQSRPDDDLPGAARPRGQGARRAPASPHGRPSSSADRDRSRGRPRQPREHGRRAGGPRPATPSGQNYATYRCRPHRRRLGRGWRARTAP